MSEASIHLFKKTFGSEPEQLAFAPGRIEFIGNHTDYNGGLVMGAAVTEGVTVAVSRRKDRKIMIVSDAGSIVELSLDAMTPRHDSDSWTNYPIGVTSVMVDAGMEMTVGYNMAVASTLPAGAGMSSSAAFELATAQALGVVFGYEMDTADLARVGRKAENDFVGVPCGILDQGVSAFGQKNHLVRIDCASEEFSVEAMPKKTHFWVFNSNHKHSLVDSHYADRFRQCAQARDILKATYPEIITLSDASEEQVRASEADLGDVLFRRALHVSTENARVRAVEAALACGDLHAVGAAISASHESSRVNFENSIPELDFLVDALKAQPHVYGARLTGGGFGGAVMAFTNEEFGLEQATRVEAAFIEKFGSDPTVIHTRAGDGAHLI
jgi:galactokinase